MPDPVLAFRIARHRLGERVADAATAAFPGLQDTPPGTAALALAARADVGPEALDELVIVPSLRGAATAVALEDLALFTTGLEPATSEEARHLTGNAYKTLEQHTRAGGARRRERGGARRARGRPADQVASSTGG